MSRRPPRLLRGLPGDPAHHHSRYLEAVVAEIVVAAPIFPTAILHAGPKFDYSSMPNVRQTARALFTPSS